MSGNGSKIFDGPQSCAAGVVARTQAPVVISYGSTNNAFWHDTSSSVQNEATPWISRKA